MDLLDPALSSAMTPSQPLLPQLPYDVWEVIASLIPERHIMMKKFYSLNSAFLHVSMAARYRSLVLEQWSNLKFIQRCGDADVCHLVKRIRIRYAGSPEHTLRNIIKAQAELLDGIVQSLRNVRELNISWIFPEGPHNLHLFPIVWRHLGPRLTSLVIMTSAPQLALIAPTSTVLSNVEDICLHLVKGDINGPASLKYLFVSSNISTLQLTVRRDPSPLFATLPFLPNLRTLILRCYRFARFQEPLHVATFLKRHMTDLLTLKLVELDGSEAFTKLFGATELGLPIESSIGSMKIGDEPQSQLQHLILYCGGLAPPSWNRFLRDLFSSFTGSLMELVLVSLPMSRNDLERFSALFPKDGPLLYLSIYLQIAVTSVLDLVAAAFPNLKELQVSYNGSNYEAIDMSSTLLLT